jgi:hypothetical protein
MIKHIITTDCPRSCPYCITKNLPAIEPCPGKIEEAYAAHQGEGELMLTGGEPTFRPDLLFAAFNAGRRYFESVHLTTASGRFLHHWTARFFDSIVYSHHDRPAAELPFVGPYVRAYLAILADQFSQDLVGMAHASGFSGLTINEEQRAGERFEAEVLSPCEDFTIKINRRGHCLDQKILLPDLTLVEDFRDFM